MQRDKLREVRGTKDLLGIELYKFQYIHRLSQSIAHRYGFIAVDTPIIEFTEVFTKTLGDDSDIVMKEMYNFQDKSGENITLRPEFTSAIVRVLINKNLIIPVKLFSSGPVFRYERPQKCRQRQFHQVNFEFFGSDLPLADIEMIALGYHILDELKLLDDITLEINFLGDKETMNSYKLSLIEYLNKYKKDLSEDSQRRLITNPLRILDSKAPEDREILLNVPNISYFYSKSSNDFFAEVLYGLDELCIPYKVNHSIVRGLDYYCNTVFEFTTSKLGAQNAVVAGGRYDGLVKSMGGNDTPAVGFAMGVERVSALIDYKHQEPRSVVLIPIGKDAVSYALKLAYELRCNGISVNWNYKNANLRNALRKVGDDNIVLIFGDEELKNNTIQVKDMKTGEQQEIVRCDLLDTLCNKI
ncbi:histidine--tRNA ligase [Ehrlichia chaffeensis str. Heartland]|uniref:Histidine--tRNA ligase n=1 Tax=Ehrlichia chaffeensis (strain ATCC CRL-10679 / Arkansas) TaxID=205920 RepID=SYH_EHRCR|nr:histidine--tRNA ligase [Ehrlichia chaffeensis]Q2GHH1.1 RecName: Full=Histidine--tRNA ligase; AltName: Full=Histidyl-tRNA synthetase; Short=HisRS [Ehrlichia chaffeensis str. Arkansas]ABD44995.1 histidyl-tRNA synthetase [Ehrlichia chaffeensis str. Arkansas]AHX03406.1 histidine--tRNA ligase [Ehrlichia chaffeensis str. Heartland]AHX06864.1 histidine--tRNA ligase [Ehrlichia chaffeensis str. Liberty]AHX10038.1 histidine--tRNA ligase [Ehrlichia chaffeensis str. West Paces]